MPDSSKMKNIIFEKRGRVYYASIEGRPEVLGFGVTPKLALGHLVSSSKTLFDIALIKYPQAEDASSHEIRSQCTQEQEDTLTHPPPSWEEIDITQKMVNNLLEEAKKIAKKGR